MYWLVYEFHGTRRSISKWLLSLNGKELAHTEKTDKDNIQEKKKSMTKKTFLHASLTNSEKVECQLMRELEEARK